MKRSLLTGVVSIALSIELLFFCAHYFFGAYGYQKIKKLCEQQEHLKSLEHELHQEVIALQKNVDNFEQYPYYKEKIIREQLQMLKSDEILYKK